VPERKSFVRGTYIAWLAIAFLALHALVATLLPERLAPLSTLCIVLAELAAVTACLRTSREASKPVRGLWWLLAAGTLLHATAMSLDMIAEVIGSSAANPVPGMQVLLATLDEVLVLLAVSLQFDRHALRSPRIISGGLAVVMGGIFGLQIYTLLSAHGGSDPAAPQAITLLFDALDFFVAIAATIRFFGAEQLQERRFFYIATLFFWPDAILPAIHNRVLVHHDYVWLDLLLAAPYLLLTALILAPVPAAVHHARPASRLTRAVRSSSPIFLSLGLLVLGVVVSRTHFYIGLAASIIAIVAYGAVNTATQSHGMENEESLLRAKKNLEELVGVDGLTGIPNRREFDHTLSRECSSANRSRQPLSLLMIDVDHFKILNDSSGHQVGDNYLVEIATALRRALPRNHDTVARYGGEEFAVVLPATGSPGAGEVARKLHQAIASLRLEHPTSPSGFVTISIGHSTFDLTGKPAPAMLIQTADRALYQAKANGRNRTEFLPLASRSGPLSTDQSS
jgi:diguanylate cyclase (GGDEF)-like protein